MQKKVVSLQELSDIISKLHQQRKTIVLATGVFDLLHAAHKQFLNRAKEQGNVLIVGLETDQRVKRMKGNDRPHETLELRLKKVAKLNDVDWVFSLPLQFDSQADYENLISLIKPDVLAVSEHSPYKEQKQKILEKYDGQLKVVLHHNKRVSTTKKIERLRKTIKHNV